jgi:hypothetical protein
MQYLSWKMVVGGERPPFWTPDLSAMIGAIASGAFMGQVILRASRWGELAPAILGGAASLGVTLLLIRMIVGPRGLAVLRSTLRRTQQSNNTPGMRAA